MAGPTYRVHIARDFSGGHRLYVCWDDGPHPTTRGMKVQVANGFTAETHTEGDAWFTGDGLARSSQLIQAILDEAWNNGFRPSGFTDIKNETTAIKEHLADMKAIAFHQLKIK